MQLIKRRKIKPKYNRLSIFQQKVKHGKDGTDGKPGTIGAAGLPGAAGVAGISVVDAFQVGEKSFKLKFSNGTFSQKLQIPEAKLNPGADGKPGAKGDPGKSGTNAPTITDINAFSRRVIFKFSDGTEKSVPLRFPSGSPDNPAIGFGGQEPTVRDIIGLGAVTVEDRHGIFFISVTNDDTIGLPYYFVEADNFVTIPKFRQHLTVGDLTIDGEMCIFGELQVI